jgi:hypothetical protein
LRSTANVDYKLPIRSFVLFEEEEEEEINLRDVQH